MVLGESDLAIKPTDDGRSTLEIRGLDANDRSCQQILLTHREADRVGECRGSAARPHLK